MKVEAPPHLQFAYPGELDGTEADDKRAVRAIDADCLNAIANAFWRKSRLSGEQIFALMCSPARAVPR